MSNEDTPVDNVNYTDPLAASTRGGALETKTDYGNLNNLVSKQFFGYENFETANNSAKSQIRQWMSDFFTLAGNVNQVIDRIKKGTFDFDGAEGIILQTLVKHRAILDEFTKNYIAVIDFGMGGYASGDNKASESAGYSLVYLIDNVFTPALQAREVKAGEVDKFSYIEEQINAMGAGLGKEFNFKSTFSHLDTNKAIRDMMLRPGKFRADTPPASIARYMCRIGGSTFHVPPTSINVHQAFTAGSVTGGVLRQPNSPKMNLGHSQTHVTMTLYFPNHETIWGFAGDKADFDIFNWNPPPVATGAGEAARNSYNAQMVSDRVIDRYLSSLRGLITQFKYAPFLPVKNEYLNRTYGITGVTMVGMTVQTVPEFPYVLAVNLEMAKFNHKPFLPMIEDFDTAIHWGKFRQYLGRASARLDAKVNQGFLVEKPIAEEDAPENNQSTTANTVTDYEGELMPRFDKVADIQDGKFFDFYYPLSTPARIFAPDTTDFRQPSEDDTVTPDVWDGILSSIGLNIVEPPQFNFFDYDRAYRGAKFRSERNILHEWLQANKVAWQLMNPGNMDKFIDEMTDGTNPTVTSSNRNEIRKALKEEWFNTVYELVIEDAVGFKKLKESKDWQNSNYNIKEWNVPMEKLNIDWSNCIVNNLSVSMANNYASMQVQLQDEPTHQHIGGGDSRIDLSMTVIGEDNLIRFRRLFEHINGLARLEKVHGVLGFLGIKNVVTSLCGIKYVLPLDMEVATMPGYPHVYSVNMSFLDFDIMQQEREKLSSSQQRKLVESFGKRNPFLRLKQSWSAFNAYPDFPLDLRDDAGEVLGHLDADWYFRSFVTSESDDDLFSWGLDTKTINIVKELSYLKLKANGEDRGTGGSEVLEKIAGYEEQLRGLAASGTRLPPGWKIDKDGLIVSSSVDTADEELPEPEMVTYLGSYDEDQAKLSFIAFFRGGYFALGTEDVKTNTKTYQLGMSTFKEDLASYNLKGVPATKGLIGHSEYQTEYVDGSASPNKQYESMLQDYNYRSLRGRMIRAFPTYMLWLIDEGGTFAGMKLFDNFYGLNSVIDFSVVQSEDPLSDTLVMRLSNIYNKLTTPYKDAIVTEDDPAFNTPEGQWVSTSENRKRNLESGMTDAIVELNTIRLKPGVRIHLRMGYGANPNALQTVFNGVIAEVQPGDILTVIAQSDAVEFSGYVNTVNAKGSSGKLDGGATGFWMSEPRDLMVRLLTMGSSNFKEWLAWGSKGAFFSDSRFGIRHFGSILYEPMSSEEVNGTRNRQGAVANAIQSKERSSTGSLQAVLGDSFDEFANVTSISSLSSALSGNLIQLGKMLWLNQYSKRDYEIFKRNIYPGNGSGIAQFMGGDQIDGGIAISTATAFYDKSSGASSSKYIGDALNPQAQNAVAKANGDLEQTIIEAAVESRVVDNSENRAIIDSVWAGQAAQYGVTDEEIVTILADASTQSGDYKIEKKSLGGSEGLLESIFAPFTAVASLGMGVYDSIHEGLSSLPGGGFTASAIEYVVGGTLFLPLKGAMLLSTFGSLLSGAGRLISGAGNGGNSGLGRLLGLQSGIEDDDIHGFEEVSFRAQTYMKSVWDLFELCAALLPNYIVAVRPFEDRSTVFYGKPHWLYTSGVVPVTTGVPKDLTSLPMIDDPDSAQADFLKRARNSSNDEVERMMQVVDQTSSLKDIMNFNVGANVDPYNTTGGERAALTTREDAIAAVEALGKIENLDDDALVVAEVIKSIDTTALSPDQLNALLNGLPTMALVMDSMDDYIVGVHFPLKSKWDDDEKYKEALKAWITAYVSKAEFDLAQSIAKPDTKKVVNDLLVGDSLVGAALAQTELEQLASTLPEQQKLSELYTRDPVTFAYQFGWKINTIPVYFDPTSGYGVDTVGTMARKLYDEKFSNTVNATNDERSVGEAQRIWSLFRMKFRLYKKVNELYDQYFPSGSPGAGKFDAVMDTFMRFMWQDPFNRAWVVNVVDKTGDGALDTLTPGSREDTFSFDKVVPVWQTFISSADLATDPLTNEVKSPAARRFMENNQGSGKDSNNFFSGVAEDVGDWVDQNIGQVIGLITDTLAGFISTIRMSLMQMGNAVSQSGDMQRQANILNATLYDSYYYQAGAEGSLLRLVDNPFTREYGEPVIEIREPFQRIHFVSSFDNILDNKVAENLQGVATVVTAVSDGKYPVTVHFDKGISPERQVEKLVETGLLWDNAVGSGLFGFLQPLLHPLESLRGYTKTVTGSSDQLSARRVALYHLKESLKNIYTGEITIIGNADIRPHDLLYIADIYERMYGMVEVEQVIHHFTPETGFVTAITPNAIVSINDPVRWSMLSYVWNKMTSYNIRDDTRAMMGVKSERAVASASDSFSDADVYKYFSTQIQGSTQFTQGSTAFIRDIGAVFAGGGTAALTAKDEAINQIAKIDLMLGALKNVAPVVVGIGAGAVAIGTGGAGAAPAITAAAATWAVSDLLWQGWQWVKENLLDQHGCYIQYLNKDGQPMDAGLSYAQGVAAGQNHSVSLFPQTMGLGGRVNVTEDGHYRITTNDILGSLGYSEVETLSLYRDTSMYVNQVNAQILGLSGRDPVYMPNDNFLVFKARILDPTGEIIKASGYSRNQLGELVEDAGRMQSGIEDGDTIYVMVIDPGTSSYATGSIHSVRLSNINTYEIEYHDDDLTPYNETDENPNTDLGKLAYDYMRAKFVSGNSRYVAIRTDKRNELDKYGRTIGTIFHNAPIGYSESSERLDILYDYASRYPPIPFDSYLSDGRPYTLNWEMVMTGYGSIEMRESIWESSWRDNAIEQNTSEGGFD